MVTIAVAEAFSSLGPWTAALGVAEAVAETIVISLLAEWYLFKVPAGEDKH